MVRVQFACSAYRQMTSEGGVCRSAWGDEAAGAASHRSTAAISALMYESYVLDRYWLKKVVTMQGEKLIFEPIEPG